ncbi:LemA family protein [Patescibacteria group bacterium]|nr:LemA family protein [Patescibacteria group bacterium]
MTNYYLWILIGIIAVIILWIIASYNSLIRWQNRTKESWSDIDVQLKRRYNLIPNLIKTVKAYATHEKEVFEKVTKARTTAMGAQNPTKKASAEKGLSGALKSLFAVSENYPELKASANFKSLQDELVDTENKIQAARRFYNSNVRDFNTKQEIFPTNLIAQIFNFKKSEFFELEEKDARTVPEVNF